MNCTWWHHDHDHDDDDEDEEAAALASVAVDDDPEETMGRETVGRKLGEAEKKLEVGKSFGRICHRFGRIWIGRVPASGTFFEDNSIYFEREECLRTRAVFLECWQMALKFSRLVPNIQLRGRSSVSFTSRSNPPPQLAKKNFVNVGANVENYFFFVCVIIVFFMETGSKLITVNFFQPQIHRKWHRIRVRCADDKDSYRKNAKMTYYLFCPPFHSESKELTRERTTKKKTNVCHSIFWFFNQAKYSWFIFQTLK